MIKHALTATVAAALLVPAAAPAQPAAHAAAAPTAHAAAAKKKKRAKVKLRLAAGADPLAPAGMTPKVLLEVSNPIKGAEYRLMARQVRGQPKFAPGNDDTPQCTPVVGSTTPVKALSTGPLAIGRFPFDIAEANDGYDVIGGQPCTGVYEGTAEEIGGRQRSLDFVLAIPAMTIDVTRQLG